VSLKVYRPIILQNKSESLLSLKIALANVAYPGRILKEIDVSQLFKEIITSQCISDENKSVIKVRVVLGGGVSMEWK
jgi:hypothetical protein